MEGIARKNTGTLVRADILAPGYGTSQVTLSDADLRYILAKGMSQVCALTTPGDLYDTSCRVSWGILPQTPVFSLRSVRCLLQTFFPRTHPVTERRAKRENGALGKDPPGNTMLFF